MKLEVQKSSLLVTEKVRKVTHVTTEKGLLKKTSCKKIKDKPLPFQCLLPLENFLHVLSNFAQTQILRCSSFGSYQLDLLSFPRRQSWRWPLVWEKFCQLLCCRQALKNYKISNFFTRKCAKCSFLTAGFNLNLFSAVYFNFFRRCFVLITTFFLSSFGWA